ncbi:MinD-like ATPase involved in chromosome partitioning or flagellar assembly [Arthrobacter sp. GAS37]|uniref:MinD/ParA family ATP-binding protein n=1 Tax=Arthrobacter sp. GAS37 TaxID=3156261 RepID=UPI0038346712
MAVTQEETEQHQAEDPLCRVEEWLAPAGTYVRERRSPHLDLITAPAAPVERKAGLSGFRQKAGLGLFRRAPDPAAEQLLRERTAAAQRQFSRPMNVLVANPCGGSGVTACVLGISGTFGTLRGGSVLAWDTHESFGGLGVRTMTNGGSRTVIDLLADAGNFDRIDARAGDLGAYWRAQPGAFFDVLVSDQDAARPLELGAPEFRRIHQLLTRFRDLVIIDTGNNTRRPNFLAAVEVCDQLVIPTTAGPDSLWAVSMLIDQLEAMGRADLVNTAIVILTDANPADATSASRQKALDWLGTWARTIVEVPYDGHIAARSTIDYRLLAEPTRNAFLEAAALIAEGLTNRGHQPPATEPPGKELHTAVPPPAEAQALTDQSMTDQFTNYEGNLK